MQRNAGGMVVKCNKDIAISEAMMISPSENVSHFPEIHRTVKWKAFREIVLTAKLENNTT